MKLDFYFIGVTTLVKYEWISQDSPVTTITSQLKRFFSTFRMTGVFYYSAFLFWAVRTGSRNALV